MGDVVKSITLRVATSGDFTAFRQAGEEIDKMAAKAAAAARSGGGLMGGSGFDPFHLALRPKFKADEGAVRDALATFTNQLRDQADAHELNLKVNARLQGPLTQGGLDSEATERFRATGQAAGQISARLAEAKGHAGGLLNAVHGARGALKEAAKFGATFLAVIEGAEIAWDGVKLISAAVTGNYQDQVEAAKEAEEAIKGLPFVGEKILHLGEKINHLTIEKFTHEHEYVQKLKEATAEQEKQIKSMEKRVELGKKNIEHATQAVNGLGEEFGPGVSDDQKRAIKGAKDEAALRDALQGEGLRKGGKLTETGLALEREGRRRLANEALQQIADQREEQIKASASVAAAKLDAEGKPAEAERARLLEQQRQAEVAAAKKGEFELARIKAVDQAELAALDARQKRDADAEAKKAQDAAALEVEEKLKAAAEIEAAQLEADGKVAEAERVRFLEQQREKEAAAAKEGDAALARAQAVDQAELAAFDAKQAAKENKDNKDLRLAANATLVSSRSLSGVTSSEDPQQQIAANTKKQASDVSESKRTLATISGTLANLLRETIAQRTSGGGTTLSPF